MFDTRSAVKCFSAAQHKQWGNFTNFFPVCARLIKMVALRPECICAVWLWLYLSSPPSLFSLARGQESQELDGCQKRPACRAAETFTSQAGRDTGSDPRRKGEEKKKWEIILNSIFYSARFCFLSCPLLKPNCICPPLLAGGNCRLGRLYCVEEGGGGSRGGIGFREFSWGEK